MLNQVDLPEGALAHHPQNHEVLQARPDRLLTGRSRALPALLPRVHQRPALLDTL
jgi:hypothetical protein